MCSTEKLIKAVRCDSKLQEKNSKIELFTFVKIPFPESRTFTLKYASLTILFCMLKFNDIQITAFSRI